MLTRRNKARAYGIGLVIVIAGNGIREALRRHGRAAIATGEESGLTEEADRWMA